MPKWHKKNPSAVLPPMPASAVWTAAGYKFVWHLDSSDYHQLDTLGTSRTVFGLGGFTNAQPGNTGNFQGEIDEIRIRSGVASADWVKAEYDNATDACFLKIVRLPVSGLTVFVR